jgi:predicted ATPase
MLMDIFHETAPIPADRKLRIHFHSFMRDVLASLHRLNQHATPSQRQRYADNMVQLVAKNVASQASLLCFDEMQIPDVGSAAVLYRLFHHLQEYGVVMVATSNRAPTTLYQGRCAMPTLDIPTVDITPD